MKQLRLDELPTILVEGKVCAEPVSSKIDCPTFVTRAYPGDDNFVVSECLVEAANELDFQSFTRVNCWPVEPEPCAH